jgi:Ni/Co efflux regulator RcnB
MKTKLLLVLVFGMFLCFPTVQAADEANQVKEQKQSEVQAKKQEAQKSQNENGAMKRGQHRYRNAKGAVNSKSQGTAAQKRAGKGFGQGYTDSNGDGVCDHYQQRAAGNNKTESQVNKK